MRFIELTSRDGYPILVSVNHILTISKEDDFTDVTLMDGITWVRETPDEILIKIRG